MRYALAALLFAWCVLAIVGLSVLVEALCFRIRHGGSDAQFDRDLADMEWGPVDLANGRAFVYDDDQLWEEIDLAELGILKDPAGTFWIEWEGMGDGAD